jgi:peptide-methionine (S)-S-oxide reductase
MPRSKRLQEGMKRLMFAILALSLTAATPAPQLAKATFSGGCFWCMEPPFERLGGVVSVVSGYTGGTRQHPTYEEVSAGGTGHRESVEVTYDPGRVTYGQLIDVYWHNVDPLDDSGQFCDHGSQYRTAIFYHDAAQKQLAEQSKATVEKKLGKQVHTDILPASQFWPAEEYHQDYYKKNPVRYRFYRLNCGRDRRLKAVWGMEPAH